MSLSTQANVKQVLFLASCFISTLSYSQIASAEAAEYNKNTLIEGSFSSIGSDTMANLMTLWSKEFQRFHPAVSIQIQAAGSATAPPALIDSIASIGPMSRKMKSNEIADFEAHFSYQPVAIPVAIDALSVYVNKDNPIKGLTLAQVDAIFSKEKNCGYKSSISNWKDAGLSGELGNSKIQLFGRNSISGTYSYFKKKALCKGHYRTDLIEQPGSAAVVQSVSNNLAGIGYSGIGYKTDGVRIVPLSRKPGMPYLVPTEKAIERGDYPLSRFLYIYVNKKPHAALANLEKEFLRYVLSKQGQKIVRQDGYVPLPDSIIEKSLQAIE